MRSGTVADLSVDPRARRRTSTRRAGVGRQGVAPPGADGGGLRRRRADDQRARARPHRAGRWTSSRRSPGSASAFRSPSSGRSSSRIGRRAHQPDGRDRARRPQALRAARRHGDGRVHPAHLRQHPQQEARGGDRRPRPRRQVRAAGAFMKDKARARELAVALTSVARAMGKPTRAVMTAMDEPLGHAVGNALEVAESVECLQGIGPRRPDGGHLRARRADAPPRRARRRTPRPRGSSSSGASPRAPRSSKFRELVAAQGGDPRVADDPVRPAGVPGQGPASKPADGLRVRSVDALGVALAALRLGAGRARAEDSDRPRGRGRRAWRRSASASARASPSASSTRTTGAASPRPHAILASAIVVGRRAASRGRRASAR